MIKKKETIENKVNKEKEKHKERLNGEEKKKEGKERERLEINVCNEGRE